jgi:hypothetical protein
LPDLLQGLKMAVKEQAESYESRQQRKTAQGFSLTPIYNDDHDSAIRFTRANRKF